MIRQEVETRLNKKKTQSTLQYEHCEDICNNCLLEPSLEQPHMFRRNPDDSLTRKQSSRIFSSNPEFLSGNIANKSSAVYILSLCNKIQSLTNSCPCFTSLLSCCVFRTQQDKFVCASPDEKQKKKETKAAKADLAIKEKVIPIKVFHCTALFCSL